MDQDQILSYLKKMRSLFSYVVENPYNIIKELASIVPSKYMVFPCDIIDIRNFLLKDRIISSKPILLFSEKFAEKYLKDYSLFLVLDASKIEAETYKYGGFQINFCGELDITSLIVRIIVNEPAAAGSFDQIKNIVQEFGLGVECLVSNSVPGISSPNKRLSQVIFPKTAKRIISMKSDLPLSQKEKNIFEFLRDIKQNRGLNIQMRVAGGWVRDKLLGKESDDIDIAVDMPGYDFAKIVAQDAVRYNITHDPKAYKVSLEKSADPNAIEPSDDLMVGAVHLFGQKIEFVPMRTEHYPDPNSRQPSIKLTNDPQEDVKRRDLTINSLYYNIDTGQVDDFVGGKKDLGLEGSGKILLRTPDEPMKTFHEDPLRLLRVLRFHARYPNSVVDPSVIKAMADPSIQESYGKKVASERAGPEIRKMMESENPVAAIKMFLESGLYEVAFGLKDAEGLHEDRLNMDQKSPWHNEKLLGHTMQVIENLQKILPPATDEETKRKKSLTMLAGMLHDFGKMDLSVQTMKKNNPAFEGHTQYKGHENVSETMALKILNDIGTTKEEKNFVGALVGAHMMPHNAQEWAKSKKTPKGPGNLVEKLKIKGNGGSDDMFEYAFYHAEADAQAGKNDFNQEGFDQGREYFRKYNSDPDIEFTKTQGPVIRGDIVKSIFDELAREKGLKILPSLINDTIQRLIQMQYTRKIDMSFTSMPEGPERQAAMQNSQNDAMNKVKSFMYGNYNKYLSPQQEGNTMGSNWFKKTKVSQVAPLIGDVSDKDPEIKKGPKEALPKYEVDMKLRDRRRSVSQPQAYGRVESIKDNKIKILWNYDKKENQKEEIFDIIQDTALLSMISGEV